RCRHSATKPPLRRRPFDVYTTGAADDGALVYGRATSWNRAAQEADEGEFSQGLFTAALLEALRNACDEQGRITGDSLKTYFENLHGSSEDLARQKPRVEVSGTVVFGEGGGQLA